MKILICDYGLIDSNKKKSADNCINELVSSDNTTFVITSKTTKYESMNLVKMQGIRFNYALVSNGTKLINEEGDIFKNFIITKEDVIKIVYFLLYKNSFSSLQYIVSTAKEVHLFDDKVGFGSFFDSFSLKEEIVGMSIRVCDQDEELIDMLLCQINKYIALEIAVKNNDCIDIVLDAMCSRKAIKYLQKSLNCNDSQTYLLGNSLSDIVIAKGVCKFFSLENSPNVVKQYASCIVSSLESFVNIIDKNENIEFDDLYYENVISTYGYMSLKFKKINFNLGQIPKETMQNKWLCHTNVDTVAFNYQNGEDCIITTGIGLSGDPHIGTLSQILRAIYLQKKGFMVQVVLGDLDSYNARNQDLDIVRQRAKKYEVFIKKLGFDVNLGILRNQFDYYDTMQTAFVISKYLDDEDFLNTEEDLSYLYKEKEVYKGIGFPIKMSILLMISDFIYLIDSKQYSNVIVMLGVEEHLYVRMADTVLKRMGKKATFSGLYSKIIRGLNGYPKMSKSIAGSAISIDMSEQEISSLILNEKDDYINPDDSVVFQMITATSNHSDSEMFEIYDSCYKKNEKWKDYKKKYIKHLVEIIRLWELS